MVETSKELLKLHRTNITDKSIANVSLLWSEHEAATSIGHCLIENMLYNFSLDII